MASATTVKLLNAVCDFDANNFGYYCRPNTQTAHTDKEFVDYITHCTGTEPTAIVTNTIGKVNETLAPVNFIFVTATIEDDMEYSFATYLSAVPGLTPNDKYPIFAVPLYNSVAFTKLTEMWREFFIEDYIARMIQIDNWKKISPVLYVKEERGDVIRRGMVRFDPDDPENKSKKKPIAWTHNGYPAWNYIGANKNAPADNLALLCILQIAHSLDRNRDNEEED